MFIALSNNLNQWRRS